VNTERSQGQVTRFRECVRALILSPQPAVFLIRMAVENGELWIAPGGGIGEGENREDALRRELREEIGLVDVAIGPHIWNRECTFPWRGQRIEQREFFYIVRTDRFVADLSGNPVAHEREAITEARWWAVHELPLDSTEFAPIRLGSLVTDLLRNGPPARPIDTGV
jgi:ADP-ribose pyrophosphatase YjhB (NUDIX family)